MGFSLQHLYKPTLWKLAKVVYFLACFTFVAYQGWMCTVKYLAGELATRISHEPLRNLPIPGIGLCHWVDYLQYDSDVLQKYGLDYYNYVWSGTWTAETNESHDIEPVDIYEEATRANLASLFANQTNIWFKETPLEDYNGSLDSPTIVDTIQGKCVVYEDLPIQTLNGGLWIQNLYGAYLYVFMKHQFTHTELGSTFFIRYRLNYTFLFEQ